MAAKVKARGTSKKTPISVTFPEIVSMDILAEMNDEDLVDRMKSLFREKDKLAKKTNMSLLPWEFEVAYVQRELQIRKVRREAHQEFLKKSGEVNNDQQKFDADSFIN